VFASAYNIHFYSFDSVDGNMANVKTKLNTTAVTTKNKFVDWACHYACNLSLPLISVNSMHFVTAQNTAQPCCNM